MYKLKEKRSKVRCLLLTGLLLAIVLIFNLEIFLNLAGMPYEGGGEREIKTDKKSNNATLDMQVQVAKNGHMPQLKSALELLKNVEDISAAEISKITKGFMSDKPTFVLNVGPKKTASTSLQCALSQNNPLIVNNSRYRYFGRKPGHGCTVQKKVNMLHGTLSTSDDYSTFTTDIKTELKASRNPMYSWESISSIVKKLDDNVKRKENKFTDMIKDIEEMAQIHVIATYRRFYEWVPSYYNQRLNIHTFKTKLKDFGSHSINTKCQISLASYINEAGNCTDFPDYDPEKHPIQAISDAFASILGIMEVTLSNIYIKHTSGSDDITAAFFQQTLPDSENLQNLLIDGHGLSSGYLHKIDDTYLELHRLVIVAYNDGLIPHSADWYTLEYVEEFLENESKLIKLCKIDDGQIPLVCP